METEKVEIGSKVTIEGKTGEIVDVSAGRVRVNFDDGTWEWVVPEKEVIET